MHSRREIYFFLWISSWPRLSCPSTYSTCQGKEQDDSPLLAIPGRWWIFRRKFYSKLFPWTFKMKFVLFCSNTAGSVPCCFQHSAFPGEPEFYIKYVQTDWKKTTPRYFFIFEVNHFFMKFGIKQIYYLFNNNLTPYINITYTFPSTVIWYTCRNDNTYKSKKKCNFSHFNTVCNRTRHLKTHITWQEKFS